MTLTRRLTLSFLLIVSCFGFAADLPFDLVITNGHIIDGTGSPWYSGDIGIRDGRIAAIGNLSAAAHKRALDAKGESLLPGLWTCSASRKRRSWSIRACLRRFIRASPPRSPERVDPPLL